MDKLLYVDKDNECALVQAGITGSELEKQLNSYGYKCGHEPDSVEFSTLGGWISTRASGMKKNKYGNIEDLILNITFISAGGKLYKQYGSWSRISEGSSIKDIIMGSEGNYGLVTEAVIKIRKLPELTKYSSIVFRDFDSGAAYMQEIAQNGDWPTSARLMDNEQIRLAIALKEDKHGFFEILKDKIQSYYVLNILGFDPMQLCVLTMVFEGNKVDIEQ